MPITSAEREQIRKEADVSPTVLNAFNGER
jgi:hypothetical protein